MAHALRLSRPAWAALAGAAALTAAGVARHLIKMRSLPSVAGAAGRLVVDDGGHGGVPVLFVHSFAGTSAHWADQLSHLRRSRRAVALNLRGHGGSGTPADHDYSVPSLAQDIGSVADALGLQRFVLVGHSLGGSAAAAYAAQHPERLAGLVLVGTPGYMPPDVAQDVLQALDANYTQVMAEHWTSMTQGAKAEVKPRLDADMRRMSRKASKAMVAATFAFDPSPALTSYRGPALLVDTVHGAGQGTLHQLVPQVPRECLTGTSHWPQLDDPQRFNRVLDDFLGALPVAAEVTLRPTASSLLS